MPAMILDLDPVDAVKCGNCDWKGLATLLKPIEGFNVRVRPGETCPAGECPDCGSLAYLVEKDKLSFSLVVEFDLRTLDIAEVMSAVSTTVETLSQHGKVSTLSLA